MSTSDHDSKHRLVGLIWSSLGILSIKVCDLPLLTYTSLATRPIVNAAYQSKQARKITFLVSFVLLPANSDHSTLLPLITPFTDHA